MAYDALAESIALIERGLPVPPPRRPRTLLTVRLELGGWASRVS